MYDKDKLSSILLYKMLICKLVIYKTHISPRTLLSVHDNKLETLVKMMKVSLSFNAFS